MPPTVPGEPILARAGPRALRWALPAALLLAAAVVLPAADEDVCDVQASRVVAIGDVHGAYENFVTVLQMTGLVDDGAHWTGGTTHLVQTGDFLDRGPDTRQVMDLLKRLQEGSKKAGGRVHVLLGNHEVMNILGDLRDVDPKEYESFRTVDSVRRIQRFYRDATGNARRRAEAAGREFDAGAYRLALEKRAPLGFVERIRAFSREGEYGRWLRELDAVVRINGIVFVHGGLTAETAALGCAALNETVRRELNEGLAETRANPGATLAAGLTGPLWDRGLALEDEAAYTPTLEKILGEMDARAIVVAHTVTKTGAIQSRFGGRVVMIDVGMAPFYAGSLAALEIAGDGTVSAVSPDRRTVISMPPAWEPAPAPAGRP